MIRARKIMFSGGGTLGPVLPLLAVWDELRAQQQIPVEAIWVVTPDGPERTLLEKEGMRTVVLRAAKLRRYWSLSTVALPVLLFWSCIRAWFLLRRERPDVVVTAGGYTSLPIHLMANLQGIASVVHQQDVEPGLTNRILAPISTSLTTAFAKTSSLFKTSSTPIGNPVRKDIMLAREGGRRFGLEPGVPTILVLGGGVGAASLNACVWDALHLLTQECQIIHSTGIGKEKLTMSHPRYHQFPFIDRTTLADAYAAADVVVARAGMGTLTELAALHKPAILVPIPGSHQEANVQAAVTDGAAIRWSGEDGAAFAKCVVSLVHDADAQKRMAAAWPRVLRTDAANRLAMMILYILGRRRSR